MIKDLVKHLNPEHEQVEKLKRIVDLMNQVQKTHEIVISEFFSPDIFKYIESIAFHYQDLQVKSVGGYAEAEYKRLVIAPDYLVLEDDYIGVVDIIYHEKYGSVTHRDVLGSVLGLGIKRDFVGDILLEEGHVQVMTTEEMSRFIEGQLMKIGRVHVKASVVSLKDVIQKDEEIKEIFATVQSLRLDSIIAAGYHISRSKASELIKAERVKVDHNICKQTSKEIMEGSLISVRGKGRMVLESINGLSKKERNKIVLKKYL